jgi:hypothetical protein
MTVYRFEIDAIVVVKATNPREALKLAEHYVAGLEQGPNETRVQITGADMLPTVLTLTDEDDIESIDGELHDHDVREFERDPANFKPL